MFGLGLVASRWLGLNISSRSMYQVPSNTSMNQTMGNIETMDQGRDGSRRLFESMNTTTIVEGNGVWTPQIVKKTKPHVLASTEEVVTRAVQSVVCQGALQDRVTSFCSIDFRSNGTALSNDRTIKQVLKTVICSESVVSGVKKETLEKVCDQSGANPLIQADVTKEVMDILENLGIEKKEIEAFRGSLQELEKDTIDRKPATGVLSGEFRAMVAGIHLATFLLGKLGEKIDNDKLIEISEKCLSYTNIEAGAFTTAISFSQNGNNFEMTDLLYILGITIGTCAIYLPKLGLGVVTHCLGWQDDSKLDTLIKQVSEEGKKGCLTRNKAVEKLVTRNKAVEKLVIDVIKTGALLGSIYGVDDARTPIGAGVAALTNEAVVDLVTAIVSKCTGKHDETKATFSDLKALQNLGRDQKKEKTAGTQAEAERKTSIKKHLRSLSGRNVVKDIKIEYLINTMKNPEGIKTAVACVLKTKVYSGEQTFGDMGALENGLMGAGADAAGAVEYEAIENQLDHRQGGTPPVSPPRISSVEEEKEEEIKLNEIELVEVGGKNTEKESESAT
jgi:hypothetical protein